MKPSTFRRVMEEWRGLPEGRKGDRCVSVEQALQKLLPRLGLRERLDESEVQRVWGEIVGDFLSQHSKPVRLVDGVVQVRVLQPSVHYELEHRWKREIILKLRKRFGAKTIRDVKFRV